MNILLSSLVFLPLLVAIIILFLPASQQGWAKKLTIGTTFLQLLFSLYLTLSYQTDLLAWAGVNDYDQFQLAIRLPWFALDLGDFGTVRSDFSMALDGINIPMVLLTGIVMFVGAIAASDIKKKERGFYALYLLLSGSIMGCFMALDFLLFYIFFEFMLLPMYFLIGIWGGKRREYAAVKFFIYTLFGSVLILLVMLGLATSVIDPMATAVKLGWAEQINQVDATMIYKVQQWLQAGKIEGASLVKTFDMISMFDARNYIPNSFLHPLSTYEFSGVALRVIAFWLVLVGFAVKLPVFPVHTWLPDAHVQAPTAISVVLAGVLLKIGGYGFIRIAYSIFPDIATDFAWWIALVGVFTIIYGAFVALGTHHMKRLIAFSSVSHMGFVVLGVASGTIEGISGAIYQMFSHGIISAMLFLVAGVLYSRTSTLGIYDYRGLAQKMPQYTVFTGIAFFAGLGLPGFSGFVAELFVFIGAFSSESVNGYIPNWMPILAAFGLILTAAYFLWTLQRMFLGKFELKENIEESVLTDLTKREWGLLLPLAILALYFGLQPQWLFNLMSASVEVFVGLLNTGGTAALN
ncbi:complex I subunit 4 family protein [Sediminitomix flava]|uniref:NADH dehydrogenase subunit M n=1 Tax=Sediminitomix flava TaxID=379075 RepID=A0A315Z748_SEDFL|nr:NADH-quinone oxidoreductase subunit M [Sediminitomix flava]PWJ40042.1 NADH dehydrogenase subunit M [Sediminitomix flava]